MDGWMDFKQGYICKTFPVLPTLNVNISVAFRMRNSFAVCGRGEVGLHSALIAAGTAAQGCCETDCLRGLWDRGGAHGSARCSLRTTRTAWDRRGHQQVAADSSYRQRRYFNNGDGWINYQRQQNQQPISKPNIDTRSQNWVQSEDPDFTRKACPGIRGTYRDQQSKPPHCPHHHEWDCAIDLLPGAPIPKARLYSISGPERKAMEEYIESSLRSGIIRPSSSPARTGFFFVGSNGQTERLNQELETCLRCLVSQNQTTWSDYLMWIEYAHNALPTTATGLSPFHVVYGYQAPLFPVNEEEVTVPSAHAMARRCRKVWVAARQMLLRGQDRMKAAADRHRRPCACLHPRTESLPRSLCVYPTFHVSKVKPVKSLWITTIYVTYSLLTPVIPAVVKTKISWMPPQHSKALTACMEWYRKKSLCSSPNSFCSSLKLFEDALVEVFNKVKATSLPPHREWDCAIDLLPGAPIPKARLYSISGPERKAMEEYIESSLRSGIIRPSSSPARTGFFFVGKKDGSLRPCIDYPSIHPSSSALSGTGSRRQQSEQRCPDFPHPRHFLQLFRGDPEAFPGQPRDIVSPACPGSSPEASSRWDMPGTPP
ncbi:hypothetical protein L3Q82_002948 [Scortum barcoo]|uniref:Uncharacterized protein n=1 Tax=Scortum barcoo TaxID=214431 RepID=A0ACB8VVF8_9TELE|nr:hypothetical protein L3Q82_002948 [Scortum barcoo]